MGMEKSSGGTEQMSDVAIAQTLVREIASPAEVGENIKGQVNRAYKRITRHAPKREGKAWTWRRVKSFWYGEAARADHWEIEDLETVLALREARREARQIEAKRERSKASLAIAYPTLDRITLAEVERQILGLGPVDCSGTTEEGEG